MKVEEATKTLVEKVVPSGLGRLRGASHSNRLFQGDAKRLGLERLDSAGQGVTRTHYETRSTFRSLARGPES